MRTPGKGFGQEGGATLGCLGLFNKRADIPCFDTLNRVLYRKRHDTPRRNEARRTTESRNAEWSPRGEASLAEVIGFQKRIFRIPLKRQS